MELIANSELRRIEQNLLPNVILARARAQSRLAFARGYSGTLMLLIRVDDQSDLRVGLDESTAEIPPPLPTKDRIGFSTALDPEEVRGRPASVPPPPIDHLELRKRILGAPHFTVPIKKREHGTKPFAGKISVGRARNNDIVLRHPTVSKFHAWFEIDEGRIVLADARSKNHTYLGGEPLAVNDPTRVGPGAEIRFGRVSALLVSAEDLWRATIDDDE